MSKIPNTQLKPYPVDRNKNIDNNFEAASDLDDICTSISQVPINPLYREDFPSNEKITLPEAKLLMDHRFWREQVKENEINNKLIDKEISEVILSSTSIDTFTPNKTMKERKTEYITRWSVSLGSEQFLIVGHDENGLHIIKEFCRRISVFIFYDINGTVCCLEGFSDPDPDLPFYIQEKFRYGIPSDWQKIVQAWRHYLNLGCPSVHKWPDPLPQKPNLFEIDDAETTDFESCHSSKATQQLRRKISKMRVRLRAMILRESMMSGASNNIHESMRSGNSTIRNTELNSSVKKTNLTNNLVNMNLNTVNASVNSLISRNQSTELDRIHKKPETELSPDSEILLQNVSGSDETDNLHLLVTSDHSNIYSNTAKEKQVSSSCDILGSTDKRKNYKNDERKAVNRISSSLSNEVAPQRSNNQKMNDNSAQRCKLSVKGSKINSLIDKLRNSHSIPLNTSNENVSSQLKSHSKSDEDIFVKPFPIETLKMMNPKLDAHKNKLKSSSTGLDTNIIASYKKLLPACNDLTTENTGDKSIKNFTRSNKLQLETSQSNVSNSESIENTTDIGKTPPKDQYTNTKKFGTKKLKPGFIKIAEVERTKVKTPVTSPKKKMLPVELPNTLENNSDNEEITPRRSKRLMKSVIESSDSKCLSIVESAKEKQNDKEFITPKTSNTSILNKSVSKTPKLNTYITPVKNIDNNKEGSTPKRKSNRIKNANKFTSELQSHEIISKSYNRSPVQNKSKPKKSVVTKSQNITPKKYFVNSPNRNKNHEEQSPKTQSQRKNLQSVSKSAIVELSEKHVDGNVITENKRSKHLNKSVPEKNKRKNYVTELSQTNSDVELFMKSIELNKIKCQKVNSNNLEHENNMERSIKIPVEKSQSKRERGRKANLSKNEVNESKIRGNSSKTTVTLPKTRGKSNSDFKSDETIQSSFVSSSHPILKSSLENISTPINREEDMSSTISVSNTSMSIRGRKRVSTLPYWQGARLKISNEKIMIAKNLQNIDIDTYTSNDNTMSDTIKNSNNSTLTYEKAFNDFKKPNHPVKMQLMSTFRDSASNVDFDNINRSPVKRQAAKKNLISTSKNTDDDNLKNSAQSPLRKRMNSSKNSQQNNFQNDINSEQINHRTTTKNYAKETNTKKRKSHEIIEVTPESRDNKLKDKKILKPKQTTQFKVPKPIKISKSALPSNPKDIIIHSFSKTKHNKKETNTDVPFQKISPLSKKRKMFRNEDWLQSDDYYKLLAVNEMNETSHKFSIQFNPGIETEDDKFSEVSAVI